MDIERNIFPIIEQSINEYSVTLITGASGQQVRLSMLYSSWSFRISKQQRGSTP